MQATEAELAKRARTMRNNATPFEVILWRHLSLSKLGGFKFRRQAVIGQSICDFFCPAKGLIVEIDGDTHGTITDQRRDLAMAEKGFRTLRFSNRDAADNIEGVLTVILQTLGTMPDRWGGPHPNPRTESRASFRPEGEGLFK